MKKITAETKIKIYNLMISDYKNQLLDIRKTRKQYTAQEYRKETGIFYNLIAQAKKQMAKIEEEEGEQ